MIKKLIKCIMILCGSIVFSVAIVGCKPTTILADNAPVLKSARPTPKKVSSIDDDGSLYGWNGVVSNWYWPDFNDTYITISNISYGYDNDPSSLSSSEYSALYVELDASDDGYLTFYSDDEPIATFEGSQQGGTGDSWYLNTNAGYYSCLAFSIVSQTLDDYLAPFLKPYDPTIRWPLYIDGNLVSQVADTTRLQVEAQQLNASGGFGRQIVGLRDLSDLTMTYTFNSSGDKFLEGFTKYGASTIIYGDTYVFTMTGALYLSTKVINMNDAYTITYNTGYQDGYDDGESDGYNDGYQNGLNDNTAYELGLADSGRNVLANGWQAIISMVDSFFNVQIFPGFKVIYLVYISLGLLILGFAFKIFVH